MKKHSRDLGLWPTVLVMLLTVGTGAALWTMLSHSYRPVPRLCFALNVCCGSAIAAGAMTLALGAHLFERLQARPLVPALLLLGSSGAVVAILGELCAHTEHIHGALEHPLGARWRIMDPADLFCVCCGRVCAREAMEQASCVSDAAENSADCNDRSYSGACQFSLLHDFYDIGGDKSALAPVGDRINRLAGF